MSGIFYNGLAMTLVQTRRWVQEPLRVGQDISGFRYTATVLANLNTQTLGPDAGDRLGGVNLNRRGLELWDTLRERLMAQRRAFRFIVGTTVLADIQNDNVEIAPNAVDIQLGPKPLACNVIQFNGGGSVLVEYTIQWATPNPCETGQTDSKMAVLAHVWAVDEDIDEDFYVSRTYRGRIQFDPRVAGPAGTIHPDSLRGALFPPIASGFRRENIATKMNEDGYTFDYLIRDGQPYQLVNAARISRLTATHSLKQVTPTPKEYVDAVNSVGQAGVGAARSFVNTKGPLNARGLARQTRGEVGRVQGAVNKASGWLDLVPLVGSGISAMWSAIPVATHVFEATAYGINSATYEELARATRVVCLWRFMKFASEAIVPGDTSSAADWGGSAETTNSTDPRSTSFVLQVHSRPRQLWKWNTFPNVIPFTGGDLWGKTETPGLWDSGANDMPTQQGGALIPRPITTPDNKPVPLHIRQLLYGGTPGYKPNQWNGPGATQAFAPDLLSSADFMAGLGFQGRPSDPNGYGGDNGPLALCLVAALQDPCAYKKAVVFPAAGLKPISNPANLPGA